MNLSDIHNESLLLRDCMNKNASNAGIKGIEKNCLAELRRLALRRGYSYKVLTKLRFQDAAPSFALRMMDPKEGRASKLSRNSGNGCSLIAITFA